MKIRVTMLTALLVLSSGLCLAGDPPVPPPRVDAGMHGCNAAWPACAAMFAQGPGQGPGPGFGGRHGQDWGERRRHLEQLRMLKMLEVLNLDEDQELEFLTEFRNVRDEHRKLNLQKESLIDSLSLVLEQGDPEDNVINSLVDRILGVERQRGEIMKAFIDKTKSLLRPQQVGRLIIFTERFERELLEQVKTFRERRKGVPPPEVGEG